jgi:hypothetical protein
VSFLRGKKPRIAFRKSKASSWKEVKYSIIKKRREGRVVAVILPVWLKPTSTRCPAAQCTISAVSLKPQCTFKCKESTAYCFTMV